jgi:phosphoglycolate phosphatase
VALLVFDLDGTLVDSSRDLASATNATLQRLSPGAPQLPLEVVIGFVGEGARRLLERALRHAGVDRSPEDALPAFFECYEARLLETTRLYDGIAEALEALAVAGHPMAVLTNKPGPFSRTILAGLGIAPRFARAWGPEDVPARKPDPAGLLRLARELAAGPHDAWMIGDSAVDVATARAAGIRVAGVTWGLDPAGLRAAGPDRLLAHPSEIPGLVTP